MSDTPPRAPTPKPSGFGLEPPNGLVPPPIRAPTSRSTGPNARASRGAQTAAAPTAVAASRIVLFVMRVVPPLAPRVLRAREGECFGSYIRRAGRGNEVATRRPVGTCGERGDQMRARRRGLGAGTLLSAYGLGCATMYWLDADSGRRRRGRARDVATHAASEGREMLGKGARDLRHRAAGAAAELRSAVQGRAGTDFADVVTARVRSVIGRACSHPHALEVTADDAGHVTLRGPILEAEADEVCARVARVRGVRDVDCERL